MVAQASWPDAIFNLSSTQNTCLFTDGSKASVSVCVCVCVCVCIKHKSMSGFGILFCFSPAVAQEILRKAVSDTRNQSRALIADTDPCLGASVESVEIVVLHGAVCDDGSRPARSDTTSGSCARSTISELKQPGHISARPGLGAVQGPRPGPQPQGRGGHGTAGRKHEPGSRTPPESPPGLERLILFQFFISLYII